MKPTFVVSLGLVSLLGQTAGAVDALKLYKNHFVTGDYVVGGVGLRGLGVPNSAVQQITGGVGSYATGTIHMSGVPGYVSNGVPQHADIVAAYLYWETIAATGSDPVLLSKGTFRGLKVVGTLITTPGLTATQTQACSGSGGGAGNQSGAQSLFVYRADVLRYLPYEKDPITGRPTGQRLVNDADLVNVGPHTISLPDTGAGGSTSPSTGNQAFLTEGASLVVVYRIAGAPLRAVVAYDGGYTFSSVNPIMTQTLYGFYQASTLNPSAKMTHIVGNGRANFQEQLTVNGSVPTGVSASSPFPGALGSSWDNLTFDFSNLMKADRTAPISTMVVPGNPTSTACLSWGAIWFSTTVQDTDGDGLLDVWETTGYKDITGLTTLVDLPAMGADPAKKDIFVEIDYMNTAGYNNATQGVVPAHSHLPSQAVLDRVAKTFSDQSIRIHFDVGPNYQNEATAASNFVIVPAAVATGGEALDETSCGSMSTTCLFPDYPGTVSWKNGFQLIKNGRPADADHPVALPAHFDRNRRNLVHYGVFAHTLGLPKWRTNDKTLTSIFVPAGAGVKTATATFASPNGVGAGTITVVGAPAASGLNGTYTAALASSTTLTFQTTADGGQSGTTYQNWGLAISNGVPRSNSGVSDIGGGDLMITLGRWDNFVGSEFMQASTFLHEFGHNLDLGHGGDVSDLFNCKPNYLSTMSYLFQVRGLLTAPGDPRGDGIPQIDYSGQLLAPLTETALNEASGLSIVNPADGIALSYLPRWYAPSSFLDAFIGSTPASKHCDGTPLNTPADTGFRIDGTTSAPAPIDWNADGTNGAVISPQDINFSGVTSATAYAGFKDWDQVKNVGIQQVAVRRNASASSLDVVGPEDDTGDAQGIAGGDLGIAGGDLGIAGGDLGIAGGDLGIAGGDLGIAGGDLGIAGGDLGGELDVDTAESLGNAPHSLVAAVVGTNVDLKWGFPHVGKVDQYQVWRATCPKGFTVAHPCSLSPSVSPSRIGLVAANPNTNVPTTLCDTSYFFCDTTAKNNTLYLYFVTARVTVGTDIKQSGASNVVPKSR